MRIYANSRLQLNAVAIRGLQTAADKSALHKDVVEVPKEGDKPVCIAKSKIPTFRPC